MADRLEEVHARQINQVGLGLAGLAITFRVYALASLGDGLGLFTDLNSLLIVMWVISPMVFLAWIVTQCWPWIMAVVLIGITGSILVYDLAFGPRGDPLGWMFVPFLEWVGVGVFALIYAIGRAFLD